MPYFDKYSKVAKPSEESKRFKAMLGYEMLLSQGSQKPLGSLYEGKQGEFNRDHPQPIKHRLPCSRHVQPHLQNPSDQEYR